MLKCDIKKYFYNIDHEILLNMLRKFIPDETILDILKDILETTNSESMNMEINRVIDAEKKRLVDTQILILLINLSSSILFPIIIYIRVYLLEI